MRDYPTEAEWGEKPLAKHDEREFPNPSHPGEVIQNQLDRIGVAQNEAAKRIGISKITINQIIKGKARLTVPVAVEIAKHLWLDARELLILQVDRELEDFKPNK